MTEARFAWGSAGWRAKAAHHRHLHGIRCAARRGARTGTGIPRPLSTAAGLVHPARPVWSEHDRPQTER